MSALERDLESTVRVGLLGCGNVGGALVSLIDERNASVEETAGVRFDITRIAVRNLSKHRETVLPEGRGFDEVFTTDTESIVTDPDVDLVVELIGGVEPARSLILQSLKAGKPVVTGNKELLANVGAELYAAAAANGVDLLFEAAAAGAIPIVRPLRESMLGEDIRRVMGIVNGTTNYILTKMAEEGADYAEALAEAQQRGYAERDPTADVEGYDAGAKAAIMASLAFGVQVVAGDVYHEGIAGVTADDIAFARRFNHVIKLLAVAQRFDSPESGFEVGVTVYPAMVPVGHPLASVRESFNAVFVEGEAAGEVMFYGRGAGGTPTASAVLGDMIDAAANWKRSTFRPVPQGPRAKIRPVDNIETAYYLNMSTIDSPGVLSAVSGAFADNGISIRSMDQQESTGESARLSFLTHTAFEGQMQSTIAAINELDAVQEIHSVLRVVDS